MMASLLSTPGKYRSRKDLSENSIPTLVSLEEEESVSVIPYSIPNGNDNRKLSDSAITTKSNSTAIITTSKENSKPPRRSSLGLGLLSGRINSNKTSTKRRSSIAVAFLGRRNSKVCVS